jgi:hypothetical protein
VRAIVEMGHGSANITSGTGAYGSYRAHNLSISGYTAQVAQNYPLRLTGSLTR